MFVTLWRHTMKKSYCWLSLVPSEWSRSSGRQQLFHMELAVSACLGQKFGKVDRDIIHYSHFEHFQCPFDKQPTLPLEAGSRVCYSVCNRTRKNRNGTLQSFCSTPLQYQEWILISAPQVVTSPQNVKTLSRQVFHH